MINKLAVTRDGRLLTVSDDKTARVWNPEGGAPQTIRVPIGPGGEGALYAVAASPVKDTAVVGGFPGLSWDGSGSVYGVDLSSGKITGRLETPPAKIYALAYSKDGRYLAVGTDEKPAVRVLDLSARSVVLEDGAYGDAVTMVQFLPDGRLVTSSLDGKIRLYDPAFHLAATYALPDKARAWRIAVSPEGDKIAIGTGASFVQVLSSDGLKPVTKLSAGGGEGGALRAVAWVGTRVFAAGAYANSSENRIYTWDLATGKHTDAVLSSDAVSDLAALSDGSIAFTTAEPSIGIYDPRSAKTTWISQRSIADFRDAGSAFKVAADGSVIEFPTQQKGRRSLTFDLNKKTLTAESAARPGMSAPAGPCGVTRWQNARDPVDQGKPIKLATDEYARSIAATPDCSSVLLGADYSLRLMRGPRTVWTVSLQAPAWAVNLTKDNRYAVAALGDGTIRWYDATDGSEALALFATPARRWIVWTKEGYFDHGDGAEDLVGYHVNRGKAVGADFIRSGQLYSRFFRPDLVTRKFRGEDLAIAVSKSGGDASSVVTKHVAPELTLLAWCVKDKCSEEVARGKGGPERTVDVDASEVTLRVAVKDRGSGIGRVVVRRNGAVVPITMKQDRAPTAHAEDYTVALAPGDNHLTVTAFDEQQVVDAGVPISMQFRYQSTPKAAPSGKAPSDLPKLHLMVIGIDYKRDPDNALKNAVNDAVGVAETMASLRGGLFQEGHSEVLTEQQATLADIRAGFRRIAAAAQPKDVVAVFLAGHGIAIDGKFYFIAYDTKLTMEDIPVTGLTHEALVELLSGLPTTRVAVLIDSCFAGAFATPDVALRQSQNRAGISQLSHETGRFILAGSQNKEEALDGVNGHGVFTGVLLKGISGDADNNRDGMVDVSELAGYAESHVPEEAHKIAPTHSQNANFYFAGSEFFKLSAPGLQH